VHQTLSAEKLSQFDLLLKVCVMLVIEGIRLYNEPVQFLD